MTEFLLIVLLIAVIAVLAWLAARSRRHTDDALPADDRPDAIGPGPSDTDAMVPPPSDITVPSTLSSPIAPEPQPVEQPVPAPEPEVVTDTAPPVEPEPVVEPVPPAEPEPIIEPDPEPVEPEPVIEPDTAGASSPHGDPLAAAVDEPTTDPPRAVIDAGETAAVDLDPHAGWETDDDTTIHADPESGLYHTPDSPGYKLGPDGQVFESEDDAREAGFTRWDEPR
jgi:outer membrane biosynthesis protein TonB